MNNRTVYIAAVAVLLVLGGFVAGIWFGGSDEMPAGMGSTTAGKADREPLYYRNPMNPAITSEVPAKDEMGMDYIPVYASGAQDQVPGTVTIDPVTVQDIGVRTATAKRETLSRVVRAPGRVDYDEESMNRLHPKTQGWIEELRVDKTGELVAKDDILLSIYSPNLVTSQEEYLLTLQGLEQARKSGSTQAIKRAEEIAKSSRERLVLLDVSAHQIRELEETRQVKRTLHIHSPFEGVVMKIGARKGQFVTPGTELFMIADLSTVWVYVDVYEHDLPWIEVGDEAEMKVVAAPGKTFRGQINYIYPYMDAKSRTVKFRLVFPNEEGLLKPEMFANVKIFTNTQQDTIVIPSEAIVRSGAREQVFVVRGKGKFEPRAVTVGIESDGLAQILDGVSAGERIVTSAQFLIDSESKLNEATAKMLQADSMQATEDMGDMEGMDMKDQDMHDMEGMDMKDHDMGGMEGMDMKDHDMDGMEGMDMKDHDMGGMEGMDMKDHDMGDMEGMDMKDHDMGDMEGMEGMEMKGHDMPRKPGEGERP